MTTVETMGQRQLRAQALFARAKGALYAGDFDIGQDLLQQAVALSNDTAFVSQVRLYLEYVDATTGRIDAVASAIREQIRKGGRRSLLAGHLAMRLANAGRYGEARQTLTPALGALLKQFPDGQFYQRLAGYHLIDRQFRPAWDYMHQLFAARAKFASVHPAEPRWTGTAPLAGKTLLVSAVDGAGDNILFVRYLPRLRALGARVLLECFPAQAELFRGLSGFYDKLLPIAPERLSAINGIVKLISLPSERRADYYIEISALPAVLNIDPFTESGTPYLTADPARAAAWWHLLDVEGLRVGLVWACGNPDEGARLRSMPLARLSPLSEVPNVSLFSLQVGQPASETCPEGLNLMPLGLHLHDWAETAAAIVNLDVVISVDTGVAHLAGALGKPVWILLNTPGDWRWFLDTDRSPWYDSARLFRQPKPGDWRGVVQQVCAALHGMAEEHAM